MVRFSIPREPQKPAPFDFPNGYTGGMNISAMPDQIALNQTPDVLNMMLNNGVWRKRYGFEAFKKFKGKPIRGMYLFKKNNNENVLLVFHDGKLYTF